MAGDFGPAPSTLPPLRAVRLPMRPMEIEPQAGCAVHPFLHLWCYECWHKDGGY